MAAPLALAGASPGAPAGRIAYRVLNIADAVLGATLVALLAAIVANVAAGVISRYVFNASFRWTEEVGYLLFLWLIFVGVTLAHRRRLHIELPLLTAMLPGGCARVLKGGADFVVAYTTLVMAFSGLDAALLIGGTTPALGLPNEVRFLPLTVFAAVGLAYLVLRDVEEGRGYWGKVSAIALAAAVYAATAISRCGCPVRAPPRSWSSLSRYRSQSEPRSPTRSCLARTLRRGERICCRLLLWRRTWSMAQASSSSSQSFFANWVSDERWGPLRTLVWPGTFTSGSLARRVRPGERAVEHVSGRRVRIVLCRCRDGLRRCSFPR